jgi:hypothetical protein
MSAFSVDWDNTAVLASVNAIGQRVGYRRKDIGGAWITTGFTPLNDLPKSAANAVSPDLLVNVVYEFRVQAICTTGGPTANSNGIQEQIVFACITPTITKTDIASTISIDVTGLNVNKARLTLRKQSDNSIVYGPTTTLESGGTIQATATGLIASTAYYWQIELGAVINGGGVLSSDPFYLNALCTPYNVTTNPPAACVAPESLSVSQSF